MRELPDWFAGPVAERYDESAADMPVEPLVDFLAELADGGAALELAIGTGRTRSRWRSAASA